MSDRKDTSGEIQTFQSTEEGSKEINIFQVPGKQSILKIRCLKSRDFKYGISFIPHNHLKN